MRRSTRLVLCLVASSSVALAACGSDDSHGDMPMGGSERDGSGDMGSVDMGHDEASQVAEGARRIEVTATSFEFDPPEITVTAGEDIAVVLTSKDLMHDFTIDELDAHVAADADETSEGGLRADEAGRYTYYCSVVGHRDAGMEGTLVVKAS